MTLFEKLRTLVQSRLPRFGEEKKPATSADNIPQQWIDAAQQEVGSLSTRREVEAARAAEKTIDINPVPLREGMLNELSVDEIDVLAKQLQLPITFSGGKGRRVLAVMTAAQQAGKLTSLLELCQTLVPDYDWQKNHERKPNGSPAQE